MQPRAIRPSHRYTGVAIALHWLMAAMVLASLSVGLAMTRMPLSPLRLQLYNWHKWAGIVILTLAALRLLWRLRHRPPTLRPLPGWQLASARATHAALYILFFAVPLVGWAYSSAAGFPVVVFGVLALPDWVPPDRELAQAIKPWHARLAWLLGALAALHALAALKHQFVDRDGLINRMLPARAARGGRPPIA